MIATKTDYYPFGSALPGRSFNSDSYDYGFNGMEKDDELKGNGNSLDFGARIYDPRLGRWLAVDPLVVKYPMMSSYCFVGNMPIVAVDPDGRDIYLVTRGGPEVSPEVAHANFIKMISVMNSTPGGQKMIKEYLNNQDKDLYVKFGATGEDLGREITHSDPNTGLDAEVSTVDIVGDDYIFSGEFIGVKIDASKVNKFVVINSELDDLGTEKLENNDLYTQKKYAKVLGHEIGCHCEGKANNTKKQDDDDWGQSEYNGQSDVGEKAAKQYNTQVNKLKLKDVNYDDLKLTPTSQSGVSKVTK